MAAPPLTLFSKAYTFSILFALSQKKMVADCFEGFVAHHKKIHRFGGQMTELHHPSEKQSERGHFIGIEFQGELSVLALIHDSIISCRFLCISGETDAICRPGGTDAMPQRFHQKVSLRLREE
jgi:hypothetical protein